MCLAVINSPNNGQAGPPPPPPRSVCDSMSGGRESDLISINCEGPAGTLGAPYGFFGRRVPEGACRGANTGRQPGAHTHCEMRGDNRISRTLSQCS